MTEEHKTNDGPIYEARVSADDDPGETGVDWVVEHVENDDVVAVHTPPEAEAHAREQVELLHEIEREGDL